MAEQDKEKLEKIQKLLERMKKIAENLIDECPRNYKDDAEYIYTTVSCLNQKITLDEEDKAKETREERKY